MRTPKIPPSFWIAGAVVLGKMLLDYLNASGGTAILGTRTVTAMNDFKTKLEPIAKAVENETAISSRLGMIQAALESSYGASQLAVKANNLFGFKCGSAWLNAGRPHIMMPTTDYYAEGQKMPDGNIAKSGGQSLKWPAPFRAYGSWEESYRDWARLMQTPGYQSDGALAALQADNLADFGVALSKRYAPNQSYDIRLNSRAAEMGLA